MGFVYERVLLRTSARAQGRMLVSPKHESLDLVYVQQPWCIMSQEYSFDDLVALIRTHQGISNNKEISRFTTLEDDLGITGDDGCELLEAVQERFDVSFAGEDGSLRQAFQLKPDEFLFHSEGSPFFLAISKLLGLRLEKVRPLTVGCLHEVIAAQRHVS